MIEKPNVRFHDGQILSEEPLNKAMVAVDDCVDAANDAATKAETAETAATSAQSSASSAAESSAAIQRALEEIKGSGDIPAATITKVAEHEAELAALGSNVSELEGNVGSKMPNSKNSLEIADENGNAVVVFSNGNVKTKNFDSANTPKIENCNNADFCLADENGNIIAVFRNGNIYTKNFNSERINNISIQGRTICFIGDSITAGSGSIPHKGENKWTSVLSRELGVIENNIAESGWSFADYNSQGLWRRMSNMSANASILSISAGINDYLQSCNIGEPFIVADGNKSRQTDLSTMSGGLHEIISLAYAKNPLIQIIVVTPLQCNPKGILAEYPFDESTPNSIGKYLQDYVDVIKEIANWYSIPVLDMHSVSNINPRITQIRDGYFADGLHPNNTGHKHYAEIYNRFLQSNFVSLI